MILRIQYNNGVKLTANSAALFQSRYPALSPVVFQSWLSRMLASAYPGRSAARAANLKK